MPLAPLTAISPSIVSVTVDADNLMFLFVGLTEDYGRIVDVYDPLTTRYRCSFQLPERGIAIALHGQTLYALLGEEQFTLHSYSLDRIFAVCK